MIIPVFWILVAWNLLQKVQLKICHHRFSYCHHLNHDNPVSTASYMCHPDPLCHYNDVIMSAMASQITCHTVVYSTVYSRRRSKKISKLRVTGLCKRNSPVTGEFAAQRASNAENFSIWWRHHVLMSVLWVTVTWSICSVSSSVSGVYTIPYTVLQASTLW